MSKRTSAEEARDETGHLIRELHGVTLVQIVEYLVDRLGWNELASRIAINCFRINPSVKSSMEATCKQTLDATKASLTAYGCTF